MPSAAPTIVDATVIPSTATVNAGSLLLTFDQAVAVDIDLSAWSGLQIVAPSAPLGSGWVLSGVTAVSTNSVALSYGGSALDADSQYTVRFQGAGSGSAAWPVKAIGDVENPWLPVELRVGTSGQDNIDLDGYGSWLPVQLMGGQGDDFLMGTYGADVLVDGAGSDTLRGADGRDRIVLVEDGSDDAPCSRDVIDIGPWESIYQGNDTIVGFDITSPDASKHDVLSLSSALILPNAEKGVGNIWGQNVIRRHSIEDGLITFFDAEGEAVLPSFSGGNFAAVYLSGLPVAGTIAFHYDSDDDGTADATVVHQRAPHYLQGPLVRLNDVLADGLSLQPGHNLIQVVDRGLGFDEIVSDPFVLSWVDSSPLSLVLRFAEPVFVEDSVGFKIEALTPASEEGFTTGNVTVEGSGTHELRFLTDLETGASGFLQVSGGGGHQGRRRQLLSFHSRSPTLWHPPRRHHRCGCCGRPRYQRHVRDCRIERSRRRHLEWVVY